MNRSTLWDDIQQNANEVKSTVDSLYEDTTINKSSLGNLSFSIALLQEQVEKLIKESRTH